MADERHTYTTSLKWVAQRKGTLSSEGLPQVEVATPPQFPGGHPGIWSPEHLFVAAAEVCLMTTFLAIAETSKLEYTEYSSAGRGVAGEDRPGLHDHRDRHSTPRGHQGFGGARPRPQNHRKGRATLPDLEVHEDTGPC